MIEQIKNGLSTHIDNKLVDELMGAFNDAKQNYFLGGYRLNAVEAGRFCEAVLRILEFVTKGSYTPLNLHLKTEDVINKLFKLPFGSHPESIRLHIPRAVRVVYDIRNKRDTAHLSDGIDPNVQDATLVISVIDWIMAELIRLYHNVSADEAQNLIQAIVTKSVPIIEEFDGFLKVLNPSLRASQFCLVLLYQVDRDGATYDQLYNWVKPTMRANLKRTLEQLEDKKAYIHCDGESYYITISGKREVEKGGYLEL